MKRPSERNQTSVFNMINNTGSLVTMERDWIRNGPDLIAVAQDQEHGWVNGFLEDTLNKISRKATMVSSAFLLGREIWLIKSSALLSSVCCLGTKMFFFLHNGP